MDCTSIKRCQRIEFLQEQLNKKSITHFSHSNWDLNSLSHLHQSFTRIRSGCIVLFLRFGSLIGASRVVGARFSGRDCKALPKISSTKPWHIICFHSIASSDLVVRRKINWHGFHSHPLTKPSLSKPTRRIPFGQSSHQWWHYGNTSFGRTSAFCLKHP